MGGVLKRPIRSLVPHGRFGMWPIYESYDLIYIIATVVNDNKTPVSFALLSQYLVYNLACVP